MSEAECDICYEVPSTYGVIDCCNHTFCYSCIREWETRQEASDVAQGRLTEDVIRARSSCPVCRRQFKILFPFPTLLRDNDDRKEALEAYKTGLSKAPCPDLLKSPVNRRYCPRGIDCLYSHTLPASQDNSTTHTYTFTHTYHYHLLLESRIRSELGAKRILNAMFSFAYTFNPEDADPNNYSQALAEEFERIHATLSREETEDPELWRIVDEIQDLASNFGIFGGLVERRMARLGRDPRLAGTTVGSEWEWTTDDEEEEEEEVDEEKEDTDEEPFPRSRNLRSNSSFDSLPALEDIDRDEDEPPLPRSSITVPAPSMNDDPLRDLDRDFLGRLVSSYERAFSLRDGDADYDEDEDEDEDEEEEEEVSEGGGLHESEGESEDMETTRQIIEELSNPLRRPRHPRARPSQSATVSDWNLRNSPSTPRAPFLPLPTTARPYFASNFLPRLISPSYTSSERWLSWIRNRVFPVSLDFTAAFGNWIHRLPDYDSSGEDTTDEDSLDGYSQVQDGSADDDDENEEEEEEAEPPDWEDGMVEHERIVLSQSRDLRQFLLAFILLRSQDSPSYDSPTAVLLEEALACRSFSHYPLDHRRSEFWKYMAEADPRVREQFTRLMNGELELDP